MGFSSFKTQDTNKSVISSYVTHTPRKPHTRRAYLVDSQGNTYGPHYDGYTRFNGKSYYELLAEMNGKSEADLKDGEELRDLGCRLAFGVSAIKNLKTNKIYQASGIDFTNWNDDILENGMSAYELIDTKEWVRIEIKETNILYPNVVSNPKKWKYKNEPPKDCEYQGYFF
tara:strand:- start:318 stop:830 length:513 start_codon:yes stop_codon:yes gene_type:complete